MRDWPASLAALALAALTLSSTAVRAEVLTVYAAASLAKVLETVHQQLAEEHGLEIQTVLASSGALARQVERGAPADVFISANEAWIAHLGHKGRLSPEAAVAIAGNRLVVVTAEDNEIASAPIPLTQTFDAPGRIAIGDPAHVPAGIYAKQALEASGLWEDLYPRLAPAANVRAALALVERRATPRGIVYASDAKNSNAVTVIAEIPVSLHEPIHYIASPLPPVSETAMFYLDALQGPKAQTSFRNAGFTPTESR